ncbi:UNVERIFIED_CONTAM: hypothetical protein HDU68_000141 [Siphonaria sp. JEL0065]|nr:hypothetical protein HDU68_000141 [Siphonaria sp. JEL0065]
MAASENEVSQLKAEVVRKDNEIKDLVSRLAHAESQLSEMSRTVAKLAAFKQNVVASLGDDIDPKTPIKPQSRGLYEDPQNEVTTRLNRLQSEPSTNPNNYHRATPPPNNRSSQRDEYLDHQRPSSFKDYSPTQQQQQLPLSSASSKPFQQQQQQHTSLSSLAQGILSSAGNGASGGGGGGGDSRIGGARSVLSSERQDRNERNIGERIVAFSIDKLDVNDHIHQSGIPHLNQSSNSTGGGGGGSGLGSVDGREFFKLARARLSYDDFTNLLNNVKAYNARDPSRIRTLENMLSLLGDRHRDLYEQFEQLLAR